MSIDELLDKADEALEGGDRPLALKLVLDAAAIAPVADEVHARLAALVEDHPWRHDAPGPLVIPGGSRALIWLRLHAPPPWWGVLYALEPAGVRDPSLLEAAGSSHTYCEVTGEVRWLGTAAEIGSSAPDVPTANSHDVITWETPTCHRVGPALVVEQESYLNDGRGNRGTETIQLAVYRVRGDLFHARKTRYYFGRSS
ncbi:MAG: hypothetical protein AMXMBFR64_54860 [Myxococcales bacterium]